MKTKNPEPDGAALSGLLRSTRPSPALPPRFQEAVWRRIEHEEIEGGPSFTWIDALLDRVLRPRFALATVAAMLLIGAVAGLASGAHSAKAAAQARYLAAVAPSAVR